jgi:hypothetical protein
MISSIEQEIQLIQTRRKKLTIPNQQLLEKQLLNNASVICTTLMTGGN